MRSVVERAIGALKGRWRVLTKENDQKIESVVRCVMACAVLHNCCLIVNDETEVEEALLDNCENVDFNICNNDGTSSDTLDTIFRYVD